MDNQHSHGAGLDRTANVQEILKDPSRYYQLLATERLMEADIKESESSIVAITHAVLALVEEMRLLRKAIASDSQ